MPQFFCENRWVSHKNDYLFQAKKVTIFVDRNVRSFKETPQFKIPFITNSQKVTGGCKNMGPIFHKLHITENTAGVPNNLYN